MWVNHHTVLEQIGRADRTFLFLNVFFLMLVAFVPFPTRLVAEHFRDSGARAADLSYGITMTSTAVFYNALWLYAARGGRLLREDADASVVSGITRSYRVGPLMYLAATLVALASPRISVALFTIIALSYVMESSVFAPRES